MLESIQISNVKFSAASGGDRESGLLGWITFDFNFDLNQRGRIRVDGISLRATANDVLTLSYPAKRDSLGRLHPYFRPLDDITRREIETQVFRSLGIGKTSEWSKTPWE